MKDILVIYYSQTGQQENIMQELVRPLKAAGMNLSMVRFQPKKSFSFPWTSADFFDAMPESVLGIPSEIEPLPLTGRKFDLIILGYQPWFLSPAIPATSLLHDPHFRELIEGSPVITVIGARNMWLNAQDKMRDLIQKAGGRLVGNIVRMDRHANPVSAVTILYWMFTGKKDRFLGIFPEPGVSKEDVQGSNEFGKIILKHLENGQWDDLQPALVQAGAVIPKTSLMFIESRAGRIFNVWAKIIQPSKNRKQLLVVFKYYLMFALFILAPILLMIYTVLFRPFLGGAIQKKKAYYAGV
jgi:hypothetical protein